MVLLRDPGLSTLGTILETMRSLTLLVFFCLAGCVSQGPMPSVTSDLSIPSEQAVQLLRQGKIKLVDTRPPSERLERQISNSVLIQFGPDQWTEEITEHDKNMFLTQVTAAGLTPRDQIVTVCNAGLRSLAAAKVLRFAGFMRVHSVTGGYIGRDFDPGWQFSQ